MKRVSSLVTVCLLAFATGCARAEEPQPPQAAQSRPAPENDPLLQPIAPEYARCWLGAEAPIKL
ncbi:MAG: hypothetical protein EON86_11385, partial [Brevundimonas sp.]